MLLRPVSLLNPPLLGALIRFTALLFPPFLHLPAVCLRPVNPALGALQFPPFLSLRSTHLRPLCVLLHGPLLLCGLWTVLLAPPGLLPGPPVLMLVLPFAPLTPALRVGGEKGSQEKERNSGRGNSNETH